MNAQENACPFATALAEFISPSDGASWGSRELLESYLVSAIEAADHGARTLAIHQLVLNASEEVLADVTRSLLVPRPEYSANVRTQRIVDAFARLPLAQQRSLVTSMLFFFESRMIDQVEAVIADLTREQT